MAIYFYSKNKDLLSSLKQTSFEVSIDHKKLLKTLESQESYVLFFDYDANSKVYLSWLPVLHANPQVRLVLYSEKLNLESLKKMESQKVCADAHLKGPVDIDMLEEIADEFLDELEEAEGSSKVDEDTSNLDLDELGTEIRHTVVSHNQVGDTPYQCETNEKIQEVFDHVFGADTELGDELDQDATVEKTLVGVETEEGLNLDDGIDLGREDELSIEEEMEEEAVIEDDDSVIGFDVGGLSDSEELQTSDNEDDSEELDEIEDLDVIDEEIEDKGEMSMSENTTDDNDELSFGDDDFDLDDELVSDQPETAKSTEVEDEGTLDFGADEDEDEDEPVNSFVDNGESLDLGGDDDEGGLDFGAEDPVEQEENTFVDEASSLDLGDDDEGGLDFGADDPVEQEENTFVDEASSLDLGDDDGGALDLGAEDPVEQEENTFVDEGSSLDLGDGDGGALDLGAEDPVEQEENTFVDESTSLDLTDVGGSDDDGLEMEGKSERTGKTEIVAHKEEPSEVTSVDLADEENTATKTLKTEIATELLHDNEPSIPDEVSLSSTEVDLSGVEDEEEDVDVTGTAISMDEEETGQTSLSASDNSVTGKTEVSGDDSLDSLDEDATGDFSIDEPIVEDQPSAFSYNDDATASVIDASILIMGDGGATDVIEAPSDEGQLNFSNEPVVSATAAPVARPAPVHHVAHESVDIGIVKQNEQELLRLQATIKSLREDNQRLEQNTERLQSAIIEKDHAITNLKAENDELKIELNVSNRRHFDEIEEYKNQVRLFDKKKMFLEEKIREFEEKAFSLSNQARVDVNKIRQREKELENQLDLIKHDSEAQIQNRDKKILQLKRKIDTLEFNMENMSIGEKKSKEDLVKSDDKLQKLLKVLRHSLSAIEEEVISDEEIAQKINQLKN